MTLCVVYYDNASGPEIETECVALCIECCMSCTDSLLSHYSGCVCVCVCVTCWMRDRERVPQHHSKKNSLLLDELWTKKTLSQDIDNIYISDNSGAFITNSLQS